MRSLMRVCLVCAFALVLCVYTVNSWCQLQNAPWPMFHRDVRHTGRSQYAGPSEPVLGWSYTVTNALIGDPVPASAIGSDGRVYAGCYENLFTFNPDGTFAWSYLTGTGGRTAPPALGSDGRVYVGGYDNFFRAIDSNGTLAWQTSLGVVIGSGVALGNSGIIYVGGGLSSNRLYALNSDGAIRWSYRTADWIRRSPALGNGERVYVGSDDNRLYALDSNGTLSWSFVTGGYVRSSPALGSGERMYVGSNDNRLYALNSNGTLGWSFTAGNRIGCSPALGSDGRVYVGSSDYRFYALNPDGMLAWSYLTGWYIVSSPALGSDERVYVGSNDNMLYAFDLSGMLSWSYLTGDCVDSSPSMGGGGEIYFGSNDLVFYCIKGAQTETPTITPTSQMSPSSTPTPTAPAPTATPTTIPPLIVLPGQLIAGQNFSVYLALTEDITQPFDFYFFVDTPAGPYTLYFNGKVEKGIKPLYRNVQRFTKDYITTVRPSVKIPAGMTGKTVTFYAAFIQAGTHPPVRRASDLLPSTPHVILMDKASARIEP